MAKPSLKMTPAQRKERRAARRANQKAVVEKEVEKIKANAVKTAEVKPLKAVKSGTPHIPSMYKPNPEVERQAVAQRSRAIEKALRFRVGNRTYVYEYQQRDDKRVRVLVDKAEHPTINAAKRAMKLGGVALRKGESVPEQ